MSMKIDAHQHFWKYNSTDYVWMSDKHSPLKRDFLPEDLSPLLEQTGFQGSIAVQARQMREETEWLLSLTESSDTIKGVVGWLDIQSPAFGVELRQFASHPKLVGVRHLVHDEPDDNFIKRDGFLRGISLLREHGLTYDLLLFPKHIPVAIEVVDMFPDQPFVIDHIAKPFIRDGLLSPWKEDMLEIGKRKNVWCKVSGMVTEAVWHGWKREDFLPYLDVVFEAFGPGRIMVGSDWPVCTLSGPYQEVMSIVISYVEQLDTREQDMVLGGSCAAFYGIT